QGMNVSMQDGFNLGWKLGHVLDGRAPESLLATYTAERQVIAQNLIDFDKQWSAMMAKRPEDFDNPSELEEFYVKTGEFPAGFMTEYRPSMIVGDTTHQNLATGFPVGKRFKSAPVVRVCDANPMHLGHHHRADGRWRIYVFADAAAAGLHSASVALTELSSWFLESPDSPIVRFTPQGTDIDSFFDVKVIYQQDHASVDIGAVNPVYLPVGGPFGLVDYEKVFATDPSTDIFTERGIDRDGAIVVVRPDQYVAQVLPLSATDELATFFAGNMLPRTTASTPKELV
ncbi:MAG: 3-hydroxybenzoate 4-monooxygenase, partial [Rhodococcus sp. (in: high G+C Gram-positive bacteria)]